MNERTIQYETYSLLAWLNRIDPDCPLARQHFEAAQERHPDFTPRDHPDLSVIIGPAKWGRESPLTAEELLEKDPKEDIDFLNFLLTYEPDEFIGPDRPGLLEKVTDAVAQFFKWGWKLAEALEQQEDWSTDLWPRVIRGWGKGSLKEAEWTRILEFLREHTELYSFADAIADMLLFGSQKERFSIPFSCLPLAESISEEVLIACVEEYSGELRENEDWVDRAINRPGGKIVQFWLHAISIFRSGEKEEWTGLPEKYRKLFQRVISEESHTAELGRVVLASQIHYLFARDREWTKEIMLPLLDWSIDERRAEQAWHGYLTWGRWNEALLPNLLPLFEQTFSKLSGRLAGKRERISEHLANIAMYSSVNPVQDEWLDKFLRECEAEDLRNWTSSVTHQLMDLKEEFAKDLWDRWLGEYWSNRIGGVPVPLSQEEINKMAEWAVWLKPVFSEVVEKICESDAPKLEYGFIYRELAEKTFATSHPVALTRLLRHLIPHVQLPFFEFNEVDELVRNLIGTEAPTNELLLLCDDLARLGYSKADELRRLIEGSASE